MLLAKEFAIDSVPCLRWHSTDVATPWNKKPMGQGSSVLDSQAMLQRSVFGRNQVLRVICGWPARSPDLSPIEHLWDHLGRHVRERHDVNNICDLERAWQAERVRIPLQVIRKLICSIRRRCLAVLAANGGHTRYWAVSEFLRLTL